MNIIQWPDDRLTQAALEVGQSDHEEVLNGIARLSKLLLEKDGGVGLAATQIGWMKRVFVTHHKEGDLLHFINPKIIDSNNTVTMASEGCLSYRSGAISAKVPRKQKISVSYLRIIDEKLVPAEEELSGFLSRVFQHELDHLDGIMFFDRLDKRQRERTLNPVAKKRPLFTKNLRKRRRKKK